MNYFSRVEMTRRQYESFRSDIRQEAAAAYTSLRFINLAERVILLIFHNMRIEEYAMAQLRLAEIPPCTADTTIRCVVSDAPWRLEGVDSDVAYVYVSCDGKDVLRPLYGDSSTFMYADDDGEVTVGWRAVDGEMLRGLGHFLVRLLAAALRLGGTYMLHGACIGSGGAGVLLCGRGGSGKSTLAAGCLLAGFSYVAEDYLLLRRENGVLRAWPTYSTLNLSEEMLERMPQFAPHDLGYRGWQGKHFVDLSPWRGQFTAALPVRAAVLLIISGEDEPSFEPVPPAVPMAQIVDSSVRQTARRGDAELVRTLAALLKALPTWKLRLCPDPVKNATVLDRLLSRYEDK